jgi:hypothetical protein
MTIDDGFEATFEVPVARDEAWARLTAAARDDGTTWLPGFDAVVRITAADAPDELRADKLDEPCAGTAIVVTLTDGATGTVVRVVQSRFGDWIHSARGLFAVGWRYIVADLQAFLATGVDAHRHLRPWGDLGAEAEARDGGIGIGRVRDAGLARRLGLEDGDILTVLAGAPTASLDDLVTIMRVADVDGAVAAEWIRDGRLVSGRS